jgi:F0F1-type ATP synthase assembly protein I
METGKSDRTGPAPAGSGERQRAGLGQALSMGTNLAVGMALFAFIGYWVDRRRGGGVRWTICGMFLGLIYGAYEVWKAVRLLDAENRKSAHRPPGPDARRPLPDSRPPAPPPA